MLWFTPKCPVEADDKLWLEESMEWLLEEFGCDAFRAVAVILPTDEFFPDLYSGDEDDVWALLERVCGFMSVDPNLLELKFFDDEHSELQGSLCCYESTYDGASGIYNERGDKSVISLATSQLADPMFLVATLAHELGHVRLLGERRIEADFEDHEPLTDLLTVFFGLGVFAANTAFSFRQWANTSSQGWRTDRQGYLSEEMFGYALALFAQMRGESDPNWPRYLEGSVKTYFKNAQRYLEKTGDSARLRQLVLAQSV
jgi:hypothetical protein